MACNKELRLEFGENLKRYLDQVVSWEVVVQQYKEAYTLAREARHTGKPAVLDPEF
jgi:hypothetical protein